MGHAAPLTLHVTPLSGCPLLATIARKPRTAPKYTLAVPGETVSAMSSVTTTTAVADFVASLKLAAVTFTVPSLGSTVGAVYTPPLVIVPLAAVPPETPFTLHATRVSFVPLTVAAKVS